MNDEMSNQRALLVALSDGQIQKSTVNKSIGMIQSFLCRFGSSPNKQKITIHKNGLTKRALLDEIEGNLTECEPGGYFFFYYLTHGMRNYIRTFAREYVESQTYFLCRVPELDSVDWPADILNSSLGPVLLSARDGVLDSRQFERLYDRLAKLPSYLRDQIEDLFFPHLSGPELTRVLRKHPDVRVDIMFDACFSTTTLKSSRGSVELEFIQKHYTPPSQTRAIGLNEPRHQILNRVGVLCAAASTEQGQLGSAEQIRRALEKLGDEDVTWPALAALLRHRNKDLTGFSYVGPSARAAFGGASVESPSRDDEKPSGVYLTPEDLHAERPRIPVWPHDEAAHERNLQRAAAHLGTGAGESASPVYVHIVEDESSWKQLDKTAKAHQWEPAKTPPISVYLGSPRLIAAKKAASAGEPLYEGEALCLAFRTNDEMMHVHCIVELDEKLEEPPVCLTAMEPDGLRLTDKWPQRILGLPQSGDASFLIPAGCKKLIVHLLFSSTPMSVTHISVPYWGHANILNADSHGQLHRGKEQAPSFTWYRVELEVAKREISDTALAYDDAVHNIELYLTHAGRDRTHAGRDRTHTGRDRTRAGRDRTHASRDRTHAGREASPAEPSESPSPDDQGAVEGPPETVPPIAPQITENSEAVILTYHGGSFALYSADGVRLPTDEASACSPSMVERVLEDQTKKYMRLTRPSDDAELAEIGRAIAAVLPKQIRDEIRPSGTKFLYLDRPYSNEAGRLLHAVPWELLPADLAAKAGSAAPNFWLTNGRAIVRRIVTATPLNERALQPSTRPLSVLFTGADGRDHDSVATPWLPSLDHEHVAIEDAMGETPGLDVYVDYTGTLSGTAAMLRSLAHVDVLHVTCHGSISEHTGFHGLHFNPDKPFVGVYADTPLHATAEVFMRELGLNNAAVRAVRSLKLIFLSACESAYMELLRDEASLSEPYAYSLTSMGAPAVLGWASKVPDSAAYKFASIFYAQLEHEGGLSIPAALGAAIMIAQNHEIRDWHQPRLYVRRGAGLPLRKHNSERDDTANKKRRSPWNNHSRFTLKPHEIDIRTENRLALGRIIFELRRYIRSRYMKGAVREPRQVGYQLVVSDAAELTLYDQRGYIDTHFQLARILRDALGDFDFSLILDPQQLRLELESRRQLTAEQPRAKIWCVPHFESWLDQRGFVKYENLATFDGLVSRVLKTPSELILLTQNQPESGSVRFEYENAKGAAAADLFSLSFETIDATKFRAR